MIKAEARKGLGAFVGQEVQIELTVLDECPPRRIEEMRHRERFDGELIHADTTGVIVLEKASSGFVFVPFSQIACIEGPIDEGYTEEEWVAEYGQESWNALEEAA